MTGISNVGKGIGFGATRLTLLVEGPGVGCREAGAGEEVNGIEGERGAAGVAWNDAGRFNGSESLFGKRLTLDAELSAEIPNLASADTVLAAVYSGLSNPFPIALGTTGSSSSASSSSSDEVVSSSDSVVPLSIPLPLPLLLFFLGASGFAIFQQ